MAEIAEKKSKKVIKKIRKVKQKKKISGRNIIKVITMVVLHVLLAFPMYSAIDYGEIPIALDHNVGLSIVSVLFILWPILGAVLLVSVSKKKSIKIAWRLFLSVEIPILLLSLLVMILDRFSVPMAVTYFIAIASTLGLTVATLDLPILSIKRKKILSIISFLALGLATYVFAIWSILVVYVGFEFSNIFTDLSFADLRYIDFMEIFFFVLAMFLFSSPIYSVVIYGRWAFKEFAKFIGKESYQLKYAGLVFVALFSVFGIITVSNPTLYRFGSKPLSLNTRADYMELYAEANLEERIIDEYILADGYIEKTECGDMFFSSMDEEKEAACKFVDAMSSIALQPYRMFGGSVSDKYTSAELLLNLYENEPSINFDIEKFNDLADEKDIRGIHRSSSNSNNQVLLDSLEDNIVFDISNGVANHNVTVQFATSSTRMQEVIFLLEVPADTVITDLNLGRSLELPKIVAPRGAADAVYEASVRRSTDPAVIAKIGNGLYQIKVFPIHPKTMNSPRDMQKIQIMYSVPTSHDVILPHIISVTNLDISSTSNIMGTLSFSDNSEDITVESEYIQSVDSNIASWEMSNPIDITKKMQKLTVITEQDVIPYCSRSFVPELEAVVLFDISYSARDQEDNYKEIADYISSVYKDVTYLGYSTEINQLDEEGFVFYGDNVPGVLESFLHKQYALGGDVYVITDEDSYVRRLSPSELPKTFYSFRTVKGRYLAIFSDAPKIISDELALVSSMTGGLVGTFDSLKLYDEKNKLCSQMGLRDSNEVINRANSSDNKLYDVSDKDSFVLVGKQMWGDANEYSYVDSLNSFISLETEDQYKQLQELASKDGAFGSSDGVGNIVMMSAPEPQGLYAYAQVVILFSLGFRVLRKKKKLVST